MCVKANGVFLMVNFLINVLAIPLFESHLQSYNDPFITNWYLPCVMFVVDIVLKVLFVMLYGSLFLINGDYYLEIALAMEKRIKNSPLANQTTQQHWKSDLANKVYEPLLLVAFICVLSPLPIVPIVGTPLYFVYSCWLTSFYCFNFKWALRDSKMSVDSKVDFFESRWLYFMGFGLPLTCFLWPFSMFIGLGIYAVLFPLVRVVAIIPCYGLKRPTIHPIHLWMASEWWW
eukprot:TRINITY_DN191_c0_g1_i9.p1 TRINITY_DN191_c0_g1~~TRINITY_DN191_c0_g1_i9.p1  ORF type:complete len:231 (-),score=24.12 TRINITY_DN191_c0_g1_i9:8-700(-)